MTAFSERWSLKGKKILVTGGSKGIGLAVVSEMLSLGAEVLSVARDEDNLKMSARPFIDLGLPLRMLAADTSSTSGMKAILTYIEEDLGGLDTVVSNVGMNIRKKALEYSPEEVALIFNTNLSSSYALVCACYPFLKASSGSAIFVGSIAGMSAVPTGVPYGATKAALEQITRGLAQEWARDGIRVNNVAPGFIRTPLTTALHSNANFIRQLETQVMLKRFGEPEEIASLIAFLALPAASYITGQTFIADGGVSAVGLHLDDGTL